MSERSCLAVLNSAERRSFGIRSTLVTGVGSRIEDSFGRFLSAGAGGCAGAGAGGAGAGAGAGSAVDADGLALGADAGSAVFDLSNCSRASCSFSFCLCSGIYFFASSTVIFAGARFVFVLPPCSTGVSSSISSATL